jgi:hypothetical protein
MAEALNRLIFLNFYLHSPHAAVMVHMNCSFFHEEQQHDTRSDDYGGRPQVTAQQA